MKHLDLFSGIGGFALAARWVGWETVGFCEIDPYCQKVLRKHWPNVPIHGDIKTYDGIECDIITGGFPCQPYSHAGEQRGRQDDRDLWPEMFRVISESRPTWVVGENVAGFINMELERTATDLEGVGYEVQPIVVPACAVDAKHRRDRVWILGYSDKYGQPTGPINDETSGMQGLVADSKCGRQQGPRKPINTSDSAANGKGKATEPVNGCVRAKWSPEPGVGRVADGIPNRMDRLRGLGNAIVPQVAEVIFRAINSAQTRQPSND